MVEVLAFLREEINDRKLHDLLWGLVTFDWAKVENRPPISSDAEAVPIEFGAPRLLVGPLAFTAVGGRWRLDRFAEPVRPDFNVFYPLASGQPDAISRCLTRAARRLQSSGLLVVGCRNRRLERKDVAIVSPIPPMRLVAAMLFPLSANDLIAIVNTVLYPPESWE